MLYESMWCEMIHARRWEVARSNEMDWWTLLSVETESLDWQYWIKRSGRWTQRGSDGRLGVIVCKKRSQHGRQWYSFSWTSEVLFPAHLCGECRPCSPCIRAQFTQLRFPVTTLPPPLTKNPEWTPRTYFDFLLSFSQVWSNCDIPFQRCTV